MHDPNLRLVDVKRTARGYLRHDLTAIARHFPDLLAKMEGLSERKFARDIFVPAAAVDGESHDRLEKILNRHLGCLQHWRQIRLTPCLMAYSFDALLGYSEAEMKDGKKCMFGLPVVLTCCLQWACADEFQYWYDYSCNNRIRARIDKADDSLVTLEKSDRSIISVPAAKLNRANQVYVDSFKLDCQASEHFNKSPYQSRRDDPTKIAGRWVDIRGVQYLVVRASPSNHAIGLSQLVVQVENARHRFEEVLPEEVDEVYVLPNWWDQPAVPQIANRSSSKPLRRRGPPSTAVHPPHKKWRYTLVYEPINRLWTDPEAANGYHLRYLASQLRARSQILAIIADARWHVHRGREAAAEGSFGRAVRYFTIAIDEAPDYADAYLQRGIAYKSLHQNQIALRDLTNAIELARAQHKRGFNRVGVLQGGLEARCLVRSAERLHDGAISDAEVAISLTRGERQQHFGRLLTVVRKNAAHDLAGHAERLYETFVNGEGLTEDDVKYCLQCATRAARYNPETSIERYDRLLFLAHRLPCRRHARLAKREFGNGVYSDAVRFARLAVAENPDKDNGEYVTSLVDYETRAGEYYGGLARQALTAGKFSEAINNADDAIEYGKSSIVDEVRPIRAKACFERAVREHIAERRYDDAVVDLTEVIEVEPANAKAFYFRAVCHAHRDRFENAIVDLSRAIDLGDRTESSFFIRGCSHLYLARFDSADADFSETIAINPNRGLYWYLRGSARLHANREKEALPDVDKAISLDAEQPEYYVLRAQIWDRQDEIDKAAQDVAQALRIDPDFADAVALRARIEFRRSKDPYLANEDAIPSLVKNLLTAVASEYVIRAGAGLMAQEDASGWDKLFGFVGVTGGSYVKKRSIDRAIDDLFPNMPRLEKAAWASVASQVLEGRFDFDWETLKTVGVDVTKEAIVEKLKRENPDLHVPVELAAFLLEIHQRLPRK